MDREKVIKGLECCLAVKNAGTQTCFDCHYRELDGKRNVSCEDWLMEDALALLKEDCHNCKLECLLQKYDELKEKYDKLLKEQEETELCDRCGRRRLKSNRERR